MFASMIGATQHSEIFIAEGEDMAKEELKQILEKASSLLKFLPIISHTINLRRTFITLP